MLRVQIWASFLADICTFLSFVLRHRPDAIGLELDRNGWADVEELLERMAQHRRAVSIEVPLQVGTELELDALLMLLQARRDEPG